MDDAGILALSPPYKGTVNSEHVMYRATAARWKRYTEAETLVYIHPTLGPRW